MVCISKLPLTTTSLFASPSTPVQLAVEETGSVVSQLAGHETKVTSAEQIIVRPPPRGEQVEEEP